MDNVAITFNTEFAVRVLRTTSVTVDPGNKTTT